MNTSKDKEKSLKPEGIKLMAMTYVKALNEVLNCCEMSNEARESLNRLLTTQMHNAIHKHTEYKYADTVERLYNLMVSDGKARQIMEWQKMDNELSQLSNQRVVAFMHKLDNRVQKETFKGKTLYRAIVTVEVEEG